MAVAGLDRGDQWTRASVAFARRTMTRLAGPVEDAPLACRTEAAGWYSGRAPRARARSPRSTSSPYMKYRGSNPPSRRKSSRSISTTQPEKAVISVTRSRRNELLGVGPGDARGNNVDSPVAKHR